VGTGAGFPGLPLALANPGKAFTLIDSNSKKLRFVAHAARRLELSNVTSWHARVETLRLKAPFDTVIARAFAALPQLLEQVAPLCAPGTRVLAMKGKMPEAGLTALPPGWKLIDAQPLAVPGLDAARSLIALTPV
jgi:16S rRNA (guanine527-N7)-methyltransferase